MDTLWVVTKKYSMVVIRYFMFHAKSLWDLVRYGIFVWQTK